MCPSYRATRDEQHTTRGRANALRMAMTGQLGAEGLADTALFGVFDLCLECKACKTECPTNVDMARLKAEFLHQYYQKRGYPLRNRLLAHVATLARWGCRLAPASNWLLQTAFSRWLGEELLGIDRRRPNPAFAGTTFQSILGARPLHAPEASNDRVVYLFLDTFVNFFEPQLGRDAIEVIKRAGYCPVPLVDRLPDGRAKFRCCGRPLISNGLLSQAVEHARHNVDGLYARACAGVPIIALEPSCILTIKDDYPALLRGEDQRKAQVVARACYTFEDFMDMALADSPPAPLDALRLAGSDHALKRRPIKILVHGHCHQRALTGMEGSLRLLRRIPGAEVIDLDLGCCGMAGSFGYEKEHYELSRLVGEHALFPAVRRADDSTVLVASGFSCRMQIRHFTGRRALHTAQLLRGASSINSCFSTGAGENET
jgi:Fe-S oxidoreductase